MLTKSSSHLDRTLQCVERDLKIYLKNEMLDILHCVYRMCEEYWKVDRGMTC